MTRDIHRRMLVLGVLVAMTLSIAGCVLARSPGERPDYVVEIRRTSYNIPHIKAADEASLGYGIGYAYAQDNICLLAEEFVTVAGQRSKYFGPAGTTVDRVPNLHADFFYRLINEETMLDAAWRTQSQEARALIDGYAAGFNRYLRDTTPARLPRACRGQPWVREISHWDLLRLMRRYLAEAGSRVFLQAIATTTGPLDKAAIATDAEPPMSKLAAHAREHGSNAIALGRDATVTRRGMLLANPHFPWQGGLRFYQLHLTIPDRLDVMGASLPGIPSVNIGFNSQLAWTHTVDTSSHFTLYKLALDPQDATAYVVDGQSRPMQRRTVTIEVLQPDGALGTESRQFYRTEHGPVLAVPGKFDWTAVQAFAIRDANLENHRVVDQWYGMNRTRTLAEFEEAVKRINGIPWLNTLVASRDGEVSYLNISVVPNVSAELQTRCVPAQYRSLIGNGLFVLDGSRGDCAWIDDPDAVQAGTIPAAELPTLRRTDFVQNSNDSAWMTHPASPLTGYPDIVSRDSAPLGARTRFALSSLETLLAPGAKDALGRIDEERLTALVMDNKVHLAELVMSDLLALCRQRKHARASEADPPNVDVACERLAAWDRTANADTSLGYLYFSEVMRSLLREPKGWTVSFDPADAVHTPRGFDLRDPDTVARLTAALAAATESVASLNLSSEAKWGSIHVRSLADERIAIPGGSGLLGVYNAMSHERTAAGHLEVTSGTSYLQLVAFSDGAPRARAVLTYSQSSNPDSAYFADQTRVFARKALIDLPFDEADIVRDANYTNITLAEPR